MSYLDMLDRAITGIDALTKLDAFNSHELGQLYDMRKRLDAAYDSEATRIRRAEAAEQAESDAEYRDYVAQHSLTARDVL